MTENSETRQHPELEELRRKIDTLDDELVRLLAERVLIVEAIGRYKKAHGIDPLDSTRWQEVLKGHMQKAINLDLCPDFVERLYDLIHEHSLKIESDIPPNED